MGSYRDLRVWQESISFIESAYAATDRFPRSEIFGLTSQLNRSAVSVASNIAEAYGRMTKGERRQFLSQARGSLFEAQTQLVIAQRLGFGDVALLEAADQKAAAIGSTKDERRRTNDA